MAILCSLSSTAALFFHGRSPAVPRRKPFFGVGRFWPKLVKSVIKLMEFGIRFWPDATPHFSFHGGSAAALLNFHGGSAAVSELQR